MISTPSLFSTSKIDTFTTPRHALMNHVAQEKRRLHNKIKQNALRFYPLQVNTIKPVRPPILIIIYFCDDLVFSFDELPKDMILSSCEGLETLKKYKTTVVKINTKTVIGI